MNTKTSEKNTTKRDWAIRIAIIVMILTLATWCIVSSTMAKYVETVNGGDAAKVASFTYTVADQSSNSFETDATINLFECADTGVLMTAGKNENAAGDKLIAPGTEGSFSIVTTNTSEVKVKASYAFEVTNTASIPVVFTYGGEEYDADASGMSALSEAVSAAAEELAIADGTETITIGWKWVFYVDEAGDTADTALGTAAEAAELSMNVAATITQLDA